MVKSAGTVGIVFTLALLLGGVMPATGAPAVEAHRKHNRQQLTESKQNCPVTRLLGTGSKFQRVGRGITVRSWKDRSSALTVTLIKVDLTRAKATVIPAKPGTTQAVSQLARKYDLAVNAGYVDERTGMPQGPLAGKGWLVAGKGSYQSLNRQSLALTSQGAQFTKTRLIGTVRAGKGTRELRGVNASGGLSKGLVLFDESALKSAEQAGQVPVDAVRVTAAVRKVNTPGTAGAGKNSPQQVIVTSHGPSRKWLSSRSGQAVTVSTRLVSAESREVVISQAIPVGSAYTMDAESRFGPCRAPAAWESRPRMAVSVGKGGTSLTLLAVRGGRLPGLNQYDSGATPADMAQAALALGLSKAYALDAGASLQVWDNSHAPPKLIDRLPGQDFLWQRPVSAALAFAD